MKNKKLLSIIISLTAVFVIGLSVTLAVFVKPRKEEKPELKNDNTIEATTGASTANASEKGGAIYLTDGATYTMSGGGLLNFDQTYGGAVYVSSGCTFIMNGGEIKGGTAEYGGAIYVENGGTCIIEGGKISTSKSRSNGGAIYVEEGGTCEIKSVTIDGCSGGYGGGVFVEKGGSLTIQTGTIKNCKASYGGGIYFGGDSSTLEIEDITMTGNISEFTAGAIYVNGGGGHLI